jgi:hypothetical protein
LIRAQQAADAYAAVQQISLHLNVCAAFCFERTLETAFMRIFQQGSACATLLKALALQQIAAAPEKVFGEWNSFIGHRS